MAPRGAAVVRALALGPLNACRSVDDQLVQRGIGRRRLQAHSSRRVFISSSAIIRLRCRLLVGRESRARARASLEVARSALP